MRRPLKVLLAVMGMLLLLAVAVGGWLVWTVRLPWPQVEGEIHLTGLQGPVTVIRDEWGIPHIYASNPHDLFMAQGFVHAQDRFWQMEFWRRIGSGRLSEVLGKAALEDDKFIRTVGWHRTAAREVELLDPESRAALEAYAEGVNAYIAEHRGRWGLEFTLLRLQGTAFAPEPWTPSNTLTWAKVVAWDLGGNMDNELLRAQIAARLGQGALADLAPPYPADRPVIVPHPIAQATLDAVPSPRTLWEGLALGRGPDIGSNNWVVAGSRTATGMPLLANDPHLSIQMPSIWYEIGLHCEPVSEACPYNVVGASFASAPGVIIGHNDRIAWGVTNLGPDVQDLYIEKVHPDNPNLYEVEGTWQEMQVVREEIRVAGEDEPVVVLVRLTRHGPIINDVVGGPEEPWSFGWQPLALRWTALEPGNIFRAVLLINKAQNWEEFREALRYWDVPSQNFVYADVEGNIGYQAPGRIPIRKKGDGTVPVPGWTGEYEWTGYIPYDELPRAFNPPERYIVTANHAVVGPEYPYFLAADWDRGYRAQRIVDLLTAKDRLTLEDMQAIQADSHPLHAEELLPHLLNLALDDPRLQEAQQRLREWDGQALPDRVGATILEATLVHLVEETFGDELGPHALKEYRGADTVVKQALGQLLAQPTSPWFDDIRTPEREGRDEILKRALAKAVEDLTEKLGKDMAQWRWGRVHTALFRNQSLGSSGIAPIEKLFNRGPVEAPGTSAAVNNVGYSMNNPFTVRSLPSYRQVVDLSDLSRSVSTHTTGQSGHPYHKHYDDMIALWREVRYHPMLWTRADVEAHAEATLRLLPAP
ncbi:MAG: penicillin acylase family protein [Anaerolineae bacterium]|nr:penicillin acylase family protein [Anaerolineae bacterium]